MRLWTQEFDKALKVMQTYEGRDQMEEQEVKSTEKMRRFLGVIKDLAAKGISWSGNGEKQLYQMWQERGYSEPLDEFLKDYEHIAIPTGNPPTFKNVTALGDVEVYNNVTEVWVIADTNIREIHDSLASAMHSPLYNLDKVEFIPDKATQGLMHVHQRGNPKSMYLIKRWDLLTMKE